MNPVFKKSTVMALALGLAGLLSAASVLAAGVVTSVKGEARAILLPAHGPLILNQRLNPGTTVTTGPYAQVVIRFDDGQNVVLDQNSEFKIAEFRYTEADPAADRSVLNLVKGALRVITGAIGKRNPSAFQLRAPQMTIGIRGTDFMVALVNPAYISVLQGTVAATNAAGTTTFVAGATGWAASSNALAAAIPPSSLPAAASAAFTNLGAVTQFAAGGAAMGATGQTGAAAGGAATGTAATIGVGAAAAGAVILLRGSPSTTHH
jgi:hypothetical protein